MMTLKVQIVIGIILIIAFGAIVNMIRKRKIDLKYSLLWLLVLAALFMLDLFPEFMDKMSNFLGIGSPVNMIFFLGFCFSLAIIFSLTVVISHLSDRLRQLTQSVALYEKKLLEKLEKIEGESKDE